MKGRPFIYADDTCIVYTADTQEEIQAQINSDIKKLEKWYYDNLLTINEEKTEYMIFGGKHITVEIKIKGTNIKQIKSTKYLGLYIQDNLKWEEHINKLTKRNAQAIGALSKIRNYIPNYNRKQIYHTIFTSHNISLNNIWGDTTEKNLNKLQIQQNKILKMIYKLDPRTNTDHVY